MKKIIDGLKYDIDVAEKIHEWDNGRGRSDFYAHEETLYKTPNGRFFVYGWSGAAGPYSVSCGSNSQGAGDRIIPMDEEDVFQWLVDHDGDDKAEELFPDMVTDA